MRTLRFRLRKPAVPQPFRWSILFVSLVLSCTVMFLFGLLMDNLLRMFGVGVSAWFDSLWDSLLTVACGMVFAPVFWRIGLVTFPQYLLGAFTLVVPISLASVLVLSQFHDVGIGVPGIDADAFPSQHIAITAYVRLIRAMLFVPVFLSVFYWMFHVAFGMSPRLSSNATRR